LGLNGSNINWGRRIKVPLPPFFSLHVIVLSVI